MGKPLGKFLNLIRISIMPESDRSYSERLDHEIAWINIYRIVTVCVLMILINVIFIVKDMFVYPYSFPRWIVLLPQVATIFLCWLYLFIILKLHHAKTASVKKLRFYYHLFWFLLISLLNACGLIISTGTHHLNFSISSSTYLLLSIIPLLSFYESLLYALAMGFYWICAVFLNIQLPIGSFYNALILSGSFLLLSRILYHSLRGQVVTQFRLEEANAETERISRTDSLTGLLNRRGLHRTVEDMFANSASGEPTIAMAMIDADYFKEYNDFFGHLSGDSCLTKLSAVMERVFSADTKALARIGGDEFIVAIKDISEQTLKERLSFLQEEIQKLNLESGNKSVDALVTVSIGMLLPQPYSQFSWHEAYALVDKALYNAKRSGRNCIYEITPKADSVS